MKDKNKQKNKKTAKKKNIKDNWPNKRKQKDSIKFS